MAEELHDTLKPIAVSSDVATIEDVAAAARVSASTVSRVINNRPVVATETRQRVLAAIARLNYRPNSLGRSLATRRSNILGLVIADITNPFYTEIVRGVEQAAATYGLSVLLYDTAEDSVREAQAMQLLSEQHVDGVIVCASRLSPERITLLGRGDMPLVLINRRLAEGSIGTVDVDQETGVAAAIRHLVVLGHRQIAYVGGPAESQAQQRRLAAFRATCSELGLTIPDSYIVATNPTIAGGNEAAGYLIQGALTRAGGHDVWPTAILAYNDLIAIGAIMAAQEAGIPVPEQLSIVGHDDIPLAGMLRPALTTVQQPMRDLGEQAVHMLHLRLREGTIAQEAAIHMCLTPRLVVRASTAPASGARRPPEIETAPT